MISRSKATFKTNGIHYYFITIQKQQKTQHTTINELNFILHLLLHKIPDIRIKHCTYELGSKYSQLHSHLIISTYKNVYFKDYSKFGSFRVWWKPVYNQLGLEKYITKDAFDKYTQEQILIINHYRNTYGFTTEF